MAVKPEEVEAAYHATESWMTRMSDAEDTALQQAIVQSLQRDSEPYLLQYVISELNEPLEEEGEQLNDEEKGEVFFVLKTVISSLTKESM